MVPLSYTFHWKIPKWQISLPFHILRLVKSLPFHRPEAWKRYPFRAEPPCIGHYREYPPGGGGGGLTCIEKNQHQSGGIAGWWRLRPWSFTCVTVWDTSGKGTSAFFKPTKICLIKRGMGGIEFGTFASIEQNKGNEKEKEYMYLFSVLRIRISFTIQSLSSRGETGSKLASVTWLVCVKHGASVILRHR